MAEKFKCPVCGELTVDEPRYYSLCEVCNWEDDPVQYMYLDRGGGANQMSLNQAREAYKRGEKVI
ncbi:MAG: CPCC family cysteine-rich protein [Veillonella caviae]|nr:CPCC family cysteine-rich protein [Veillonella caviae]